MSGNTCVVDCSGYYSCGGDWQYCEGKLVRLILLYVQNFVIVIIFQTNVKMKKTAMGCGEMVGVLVIVVAVQQSNIALLIEKHIV